MANNKSLNQFYSEFMEEIELAADAETSGWTKKDFFTSITLEYLEDAGEVIDPIMCPFRSYGLQLNAYSISDDYSSLDIFVSMLADSVTPKTVSRMEVNAIIK